MGKNIRFALAPQVFIFLSLLEPSKYNFPAIGIVLSKKVHVT